MDGLIVIKRFETTMYEQVGDAEKIARWQKIFHSVKRRLLHGAPHSLMPEGDSREEDTIMSHVRTFIERFKNPAFVGFSLDPGSSTASPAPNVSAPVIGQTPQSGPIQQPVNGSHAATKSPAPVAQPSTPSSTVAPIPPKNDVAETPQDSGTKKDDATKIIATEGTRNGSAEAQDVDPKGENQEPTSAATAT